VKNLSLKKLLFLCVALAGSLAHLTSPISPHAVKGFDRLIQPPILETLYPLFFPNTAHDLGRNLKLYGHKDNAWTSLANGLFKQVNDNGSLQLIELGKGSVCTKMNLFHLGGLYALIVRYKSNSALPLKKAVITLCEETKLQKKAVWTFLHKINDAKKLAWSKDSQKGPAALITLYAGLRAETKADLLMFLNGFAHFYIDGPDKVLTPEGREVISNSSKETLFLQEKYIPKDRTDILNKTYQNPTTFDYLWLFNLTSEPIRVLSIATPSALKGLSENTVSDCVEHGLCKFIFTLLESENPGELTAEHLPQPLQNSDTVLKFISWFNNICINNQKARTNFFYLFSDKENKVGKADLKYHNASSSKYYELEASDSNILKALRFFFGINAKNFEELGTQLSVPKKRTVTFDLKQCKKKNTSDLEPDQQIIMTIKDGNNYQTCTLNITTNKHVGVSGEDKNSATLLDGEVVGEFLQNKALGTKLKEFPFCYKFPCHRQETINIFSQLDSTEFSNLCRVSVKTPQVYASFQNVFNEQAIKPCIINLDNDVVSLLAEHGDKEPLKTFIKTINIEELERILTTRQLGLTFMNKVKLFENDLVHKVSDTFILNYLGFKFDDSQSAEPFYEILAKNRGFLLAGAIAGQFNAKLDEKNKKAAFTVFTKQRPTFSSTTPKIQENITWSYHKFGYYTVNDKNENISLHDLCDQEPFISFAQIPGIFKYVLCDALAKKYGVAHNAFVRVEPNSSDTCYNTTLLPVLISYLNKHVPETLWSNQNYIDALVKALDTLNLFDDLKIDTQAVDIKQRTVPGQYIIDHWMEEPYATFLKNVGKVGLKAS